ncbi:MAG: Serine--glyoxylate aminotransferase, partial [uncultured Rubrobacteraceae bacterium]
EQVSLDVAWTHSHTAGGLGCGGSAYNPPSHAGVWRGLYPREREPEAGLSDRERYLHLRRERDGGFRGRGPEPLLAGRQGAGGEQRQLREPLGEDEPGVRPGGHRAEVRLGREGGQRRGRRGPGGRPQHQGCHVRPLGDLHRYGERHRGLRPGDGERRHDSGRGLGSGGLHVAHRRLGRGRGRRGLAEGADVASGARFRERLGAGDADARGEPHATLLLRLDGGEEGLRKGSRADGVDASGERHHPTRCGAAADPGRGCGGSLPAARAVGPGFARGDQGHGPKALWAGRGSELGRDGGLDPRGHRRQAVRQDALQGARDTDCGRSGGDDRQDLPDRPLRLLRLLRHHRHDSRRGAGPGVSGLPRGARPGRRCGPEGLLEERGDGL